MFLSGKYTRGADDRSQGEGRRAAFDFPPVNMDRGYDLVEAMKRMADSRGDGASVAQIALAWLLYQPVVSTVIVGAKRADQLADNLAACDIELTAAEMAELAKLSELPAEYPGWMLGFQGSYRNQFLVERRVPK